MIELLALCSITAAVAFTLQPIAGFLPNPGKTTRSSPRRLRPATPSGMLSMLELHLKRTVRHVTALLGQPCIG